MKKLATLASLLLVTSSYAATTGTLLIKGTVPAALAIQVNAEAVSSSLDLSATETDLVVGTVHEISNSNTGYKISVQSANASSLKNSTLDQLDYTLKYAGSAVDLSSGNAVDAKVSATPGLSNVTSDVSISYTGKPAEQMVQGEYSDTLTFTISAN